MDLENLTVAKVKEVQGWHDNVVKIAKEIWLESEIQEPGVMDVPTGHILAPYQGSYVHLVVPIPFQSESDKGMYLDMLKTMCKELKAVGYCFVSEVWIGKVSKDYKHGDLEKASDRKEVLMILKETNNKSTASIFDIVRTPKPALVEGKYSKIAEDGTMEGQMTGILAKHPQLNLN